MLGIKSKAALAQDAFKLAGGNEMVRYHSTTYIPADFETRDTSVVPDPDRTIWLPLTHTDVQRLGADRFDILFQSDSELRSFDFMLGQHARWVDEAASTLLVRGPKGLQELDETGTLIPATGEFRPNALLPLLNDDAKDKAVVFDVIAGWLNSEEEAESLLRHLATCLAPGWSAVKYVLLLGEGRNGKGLLLKMLHALFGFENVSNVSRQAMAEQSPVVTMLNGKLLNLVYDGQADYVKDSGTEKTLVAGEPVGIKKLYESNLTKVQTNALFVESLNHEPKTRDKSPALQKRLVRFMFSNVYALDRKFERVMLSDKMVGAFLGLLIDHYVLEDELAEKLAPTGKALELQLESMYANSMGLQFLKWVEEDATFGTADIIGWTMSDVVKHFRDWRLKENDIGQYAEPDVMAMFAPLLNTERKSVRDAHGQPRKVRVVTSFKVEATAFIKTLEGDHDDAAELAAVVED